MAELGKLLIFFGAILMTAGALVFFVGRTHLPLGRLPGDLVFRGRNTTFYFPLTTSIVLSLLLWLFWYVVGRFRR
jgi:hypothetical protein